MPRTGNGWSPRNAKALHATGHELWLFSGRSDEVETKTLFWLTDHGIANLFTLIRMRPEGDYAPDDVLKMGWYSEMSIADRARLIVVFDDRDRMVKGVAVARRTVLPSCARRFLKRGRE